MSDKLSGALQENTLTLACFSDEHCRLVRSAVPADLFSTYLYREIVERVYAFIDQFKKAPKDHLPDLLEDLLKDKSDKGANVEAIVHAVKDLSESMNGPYIVSQLDKFVRSQQLKLGVVEASKAIQAGNLDEAEAVWEKTARARLALFDSGITFEEALKKHKQRKEDVERIQTGIGELDKYGMGPGRKELNIFLGPPKRGKTWWEVLMTKRALMQKWRVAVITLEVDEVIYAMRILQSIFSMTKKESEGVILPILSRAKDGGLLSIDTEEITRPNMQNAKDLRLLTKRLSNMRGKGNVRIRQFPTMGLTVHMLEAWLDGLAQQHGFYPDMIVVDYPDLMKHSVEHKRLELGMIFGKLRGVAIERNAAMSVPTQTNRAGGVAKIVTDQHVGEDYSKIMIADNVVSYCQTASERDLGLARLYALAGRNDRDHFATLITQAYAIGQFALDSMPWDPSYWAMIDGGGGEDDDDGNG